MFPLFTEQLRVQALAGGQSTYASQLLCPRCRLDLRYVKTNACATCARSRSTSRDYSPAMDYPELQRTRGSALELRELLYYSGKRCQNGHLAPRFTKSNCCQSCVEWQQIPWVWE